MDTEFSQVLEKFRGTVASQTIEAEGRRIALTVSCGAVVTLARTEESLEEILNRADQALYRAKEQGRNRVVLDRTEADVVYGRLKRRVPKVERSTKDEVHTYTLNEEPSVRCCVTTTPGRFRSGSKVILCIYHGCGGSQNAAAVKYHVPYTSWVPAPG